MPPIDFHLPDQPRLSGAPTNPMKDWQLAPLTKDLLIDQFLGLQHDIELLTVYSESVMKVTHPMGAQLTLLTLENQNLQGGLYLKEEWKNRPWDILFPGGRGQKATGDVFMGRQASIEAKNTQKQVDLARRRAELAKRKEIWEVQKAEHEKQKNMLIRVLQWPKPVLHHFWRTLFWMQKWANQLHSPLTLGEWKTYEKGEAVLWFTQLTAGQDFQS